MVKRLSEISAKINILSRRGPADPEIRGLAYDSRAVGPGFLFFALPGIHEDGARYAGQAAEAGAAAILHRGELPEYREGVSYLRVEDPRFCMSGVADAFHDSPSRNLAVIGVTGTEGKSTTVYLVYQLLWLAGRKAGFVSTVRYRCGAEEIPNPEHQTTPEATAVHEALAKMRDWGMEYAVIESSSHGLSPRTNRLGDVAFDAALMLNVTHEHLEFHGDLDTYRRDKARLFSSLDAFPHEKTLLGRKVSVPCFGVVNADDPCSEIFRRATAKPVLSFGSAAGSSLPADLRAFGIRADPSGCSFGILEGERRHEARIELPGAFNVDNVLAALLCVSRLLALPVADLLPLLPGLKPVKGRMTRIDSGQPFEVLVDYAHTPSSFQAIFPSLRARVQGRIISLFGSGGERDTEKRPRQGRIAADYSDIIVLADEDPRGEDPLELLEMIAAGCPEKERERELFLIPDRPTAIRKALGLARPGDLVLLLGKGHENSIIWKRGARPYDEIEEARSALAELGYRKQE